MLEGIVYYCLLMGGGRGHRGAGARNEDVLLYIKHLEAGVCWLPFVDILHIDALGQQTKNSVKRTRDVDHSLQEL